MTAPHMHLEDWLDDLCVRFIINLPQEDLSTVARICFQVEEAQWFYEDFVRPLDPTLPSMSLRTFCLRIFQHCPLLASFSVENHTKAFEEFLEYKTRVPVRGAIMLNHAMDSVVLVKGWKKGANWSFPRGKINKDEDDLDCAVREVYEETGLDLRAAGLVPHDKKPKYIEIAMREQQLRLYVFRDIPMDTNFQPRTRKEISKIQWYKLSELPAFRKKGSQVQNEANAGPAINKFYMVAPFLFPLKKWISAQMKLDEKRFKSAAHGAVAHHLVPDETATTEDETVPQASSQQIAQVPAIETLDGATKELHRLLKMQPPTQGLQSESREDKGSALLSILQSNNPQAHQDSQSFNSQLPYTPQPGVIHHPPQPQNPHHHTNQRSVSIDMYQMPPPFPFAPTHTLASRDLGSTYPHQFQSTPPHEPNMPQRQQSAAAPSHHPFTSSGEPTSSMLPAVSSRDLAMRQFDGMAKFQPNTASGFKQLSGESLALLNAFKRNPAATQDKGPDHRATTDAPGTSSATGISQNLPQNLPQGLHGLSLSQMPGGSAPLRQGLQNNIAGLVGSSMKPGGDQHRFNLLEMFKKDAVPAGPGVVNQTPTQPRRAESMPMQQIQGLQSSVARQLSPEKVPAEAKPFQKAVKLPSRGNAGAPNQRQQHQRQQSAKSTLKPVRSQQPQPPRILKRGQNIDAIITSGGLQGVDSPKTSPLPLHLAPSGHSGTRNGRPPEATAANRHHDGLHGQKKHLLSLFGKEQAPETAAAGGSGVASNQSLEPSRSRVSSMASRGEETPISPVQQDIFLNYLQSVTSNAENR